MFFNLQKVKENNRQIQKRYLVSGYFREDIHNDLQNIVNESLFELFVFSPSVVHFVILPLLKPLVVGEADQTHGGLAWCGKKNKTIHYSESCMNLALLYTLRHVTCFCTWWSFLPGRIFSWRGADEQERYAFSRIFPLSLHVLLNPVKENLQKSNSKNLSKVENSCMHGYFSDAVVKITKVVFPHNWVVYLTISRQQALWSYDNQLHVSLHPSLNIINHNPKRSSNHKGSNKRKKKGFGFKLSNPSDRLVCGCHGQRPCHYLRNQLFVIARKQTKITKLFTCYLKLTASNKK